MSDFINMDFASMYPNVINVIVQPDVPVEHIKFKVLKNRNYGNFGTPIHELLYPTTCPICEEENKHFEDDLFEI